MQLKLLTRAPEVLLPTTDHDSAPFIPEAGDRSSPLPPPRPTPPQPKRRRWRWLWLIPGAAVAALLVRGVDFLAQELPSSALQAQRLSALAQDLAFQVEPGPSPLIRYPAAGPYDLRLGYVGLPHFTQRLQAVGFDVAAQARISPTLARVVDLGLPSIYHEKMQTGLRLFDRHGQHIFQSAYPRRVYQQFDELPALVLNSLLFIENRELFETRYPTHNPAVEWDRFGRAVLHTLARSVGINIGVAGGSTLATQLEKFRHSPGGRTVSVLEKFRQMGSASLRAYLDGPETMPARQAIALAYVNAMPLAAIPTYGEVNGLGDGLWAWYGADFARVNALLSDGTLATTPTPSVDHATAYRQALSLLLAQRRPAFYLGSGYATLQERTDSYLRLLATDEVISEALRDAALNVSVPLRPQTNEATTQAFAAHKTESSLRARLAHDLGLTSLYDLDRLDLTVTSTIDQPVQHAVTAALRNLGNPAQARAAGLHGTLLLGDKDNLGRIVYSLTLYERSPQGNLLRVQTDNYDQPLDINEGIRLDLGSTSKLRTLVHYLEVIAQLHQQYTGQPPKALRSVALDKRDRLSQWVIERLQAAPQLSLQDLLNAALERRYASNPGEGFFTGGGVHYFANFHRGDPGMLSVRAALRDSVNLAYVRIMRDIVYHYLYRPGAIAPQMESDEAPLRQAYLQRFADREGQVFLRRFYAKYQGKQPHEALDLLTQGIHPTLVRLATVYRSVYPEHGLGPFTAYLRAHADLEEEDAQDIARLYTTYDSEHFDLHDRGYIARLHPLELWLVHYLAHHPKASLSEVTTASAEVRQLVYGWLFKTGRKHAQDQRIRGLLEVEAFTHIHEAWKRVGYPFEALTPSYASALGASGDRPAALAALMGILLNDGVAAPRGRFDTLHFAADTPYETVLTRALSAGERVLAPEVAAAARSALMDVVDAGTARRLKGVYTAPDRTPLRVGGKTGTGDHRREIYGARGRLIESRVVSRAATFVFFLGERFFGTITAYVTGPEAARYHFTSALPVQVLKSLEPSLRPLLGHTPGAPTPGDAPAPGLLVAQKSRSPREKQGVKKAVVRAHSPAPQPASTGTGNGRINVAAPQQNARSKPAL